MKHPQYVWLSGWQESGGRMIIDLLRHGELEGGVKYRGLVDDPLTGAGRRSMDAVWQHLRGDVGRIIASPLSRCAAPASDWAGETDARLLIEERIAEMHYGDWEGLSAEEIQQGWPGMLERWRADPTGMRPPGGESPEALRERLSDFWQELTGDVSGEHVLIVAHSGSLRMLLAIVLGAPIAASRRFAMPYACWSRIIADAEGVRLEHHCREA
ncbi:MAG: histidine phosphatase family protein [Mariprofundaceae bacterium]